MARPFKSGVDYFPLDVKLDDEVELLESEHGLIGFGVLIKLYQRIYAHNYWLKWDKKELIVFSKRINVDKNEVIAIINTCLEWGIFDEDLFNDHSILTSHGVQKRFFKITERYKRVEVIEEFLLFNLPEGENKNIVYVDINSVNDCKSTQKKEKETKPKETNDEIERTKLFEKAFEKWWLTYPKRAGRRVGKKKAKEKFMKMDQSTWTNLNTATINYTTSLLKSGLSPSDAHRFLNETWKEYIEEADQSESNETEEGFKGFTEEEANKIQQEALSWNTPS